MTLINSPAFNEMKQWSGTTNERNNHNIQGTVVRTVAALEKVATDVDSTVTALEKVATDVDSFEPRFQMLNTGHQDLHARIQLLETNIAQNIRQNTSSHFQRATAAALVFTGFASILAMPLAVSVVSSKTTCPVDSNHSAKACNLAISALAGVSLGVVAGLIGLFSLCCNPRVPQ